MNFLKNYVVYEQIILEFSTLKVFKKFINNNLFVQISLHKLLTSHQ